MLDEGSIDSVKPMIPGILTTTLKLPIVEVDQRHVTIRGYDFDPFQVSTLCVAGSVNTVM